MLRRIESVSLKDMAGDIISENPDALAEINRQQLLLGKNNKGQPLPSIIGDPWFKKPGADVRYADWKHKNFPQTPWGISNFTVINVYHNSISVRRMGQNVHFDASASFAAAIDTKTDNGTLGLNDDGKSAAWKQVIRSPLVHRVASILGCKVV